MTSPSRRSFLRRGLLGGALLVGAGTLGGIGLALWPTRRAAPRRALHVLDPVELSILVAAVEVMAPGGDALEVAHRADEFLSAQSEPNRRDVRRLLHLLESGLFGALLDARPIPFSRLSLAGRARALQAMRDSRLMLRRGGYQVLRRLCTSMRWTDPGAWPTIGYLGPPQIGTPT